MSDEFKPMRKPIAWEIDGWKLCAIMPVEADPEAETWVFLPKVRVTGNLEITGSNGYFLPSFKPQVDR